MRFSLSVFFLLVISNIITSQTSIDGNFAFQTDSAKKYSLYIPSSYDASEPQTLMLGLHPLNVNRWDAQSWRDTLIIFAEENNLLLVCPDGGIDGKVDSPIDTAFTTALLDSISNWYNINQDEKYIMGFSWGAKTSYTYGLRRTNAFKGFLIIGAAVTLSEINGINQNANGESFYLVHGNQDNVNVRFTPLLNSLEDNHACTNSLLMNNVGHTIDFPNRNQIIGEAFQWLKNEECSITSSTEDLDKSDLKIYPNPSNGDFRIENIDLGKATILIYDLMGQQVSFTQVNNNIRINSDYSGILYLIVDQENKSEMFKVVVY